MTQSAATPNGDPSLDMKMLSGWPVAGITYDPDYEDENGSSHIKPCPSCGAGTDQPCEDDCKLVTG